jgi:hypothetical protein
MTVFRVSKSFFASRNSDASVVQPGVLALGKKNSTTRFPWHSPREISLLSSVFKRNSGALSPGFSIALLPERVKSPAAAAFRRAFSFF